MTGVEFLVSEYGFTPKTAFEWIQNERIYLTRDEDNEPVWRFRRMFDGIEAVLVKQEKDMRRMWRRMPEVPKCLLDMAESLPSQKGFRVPTYSPGHNKKYQKDDADDTVGKDMYEL